MEQAKRKKKISIIGAGSVGSAVLNDIIQKFPEDEDLEIIFYNRNKVRAKGEARDIVTSKRAITQTITPTDRIEDISNSDVIIFTAGTSAVTTQSSDRIRALPYVIRMIKGYGEMIRQYSPESLVVVCTNPVDIVTGLMTHYSGNFTIGTGTELDSRRFEVFLKKFLEEALPGLVKKVSARVIGGHSGNEMIVPRDSIKINNIRVTEIDELERVLGINETIILDLIEKAKEKMKKEGFKIVEQKGHSGSSYGPAKDMADIAYSYLYGGKLDKDELDQLSEDELAQYKLEKGKLNITASCVLRGEGEYYENRDCVLSVPVIIDKGQVTISKRSLSLNDEELEKLISVSQEHFKLVNDITGMDIEGKKSKLLDEFLKSVETKEKELDAQIQRVSDIITSAVPNTEIRQPTAFRLNKQESSKFNINYVANKILISLKDPKIGKDEYRNLQKHLIEFCNHEENSKLEYSFDKSAITISNTENVRNYLEEVGLSNKPIVVAEAKL